MMLSLNGFRGPERNGHGSQTQAIQSILSSRGMLSQDEFLSWFNLATKSILLPVWGAQSSSAWNFHPSGTTPLRSGS